MLQGSGSIISHSQKPLRFPLLGSKAIVGVNMWPSLECPAHLQKAQEDGRMYRVSRAQHSIPEQQHYVCDDNVAQGG